MSVWGSKNLSALIKLSWQSKGSGYYKSQILCGEDFKGEILPAQEYFEVSIGT
jgi:hypothetical protein